MLKTIFFALILASCCPSKPQYQGGIQLTQFEQPKPVLYAKIDGEIVRYHYAADEPGAYEKQYPELAKGLEYIGCGVVYSFNGMVQDTAFSRVQYFWKKKFVGLGE